MRICLLTLLLCSTLSGSSQWAFRLPIPGSGLRPEGTAIIGNEVFLAGNTCQQYSQQSVEWANITASIYSSQGEPAQLLSSSSNQLRDFRESLDGNLLKVSLVFEAVFTCSGGPAHGFRIKKITPSLATIWEVFVPVPVGDWPDPFPYEIHSSTNGETILVGIGEYGLNGVSNGFTSKWIARLSGEGEVLWENFFSEEEFSTSSLNPYDVLATESNTYLSVKYPDSTLFAFDQAGLLLWEKPYSEIGFAIQGMAEGPDSEVFFSGAVIDGDNENQLVVGEFDTDGLVLWTEEIEGYPDVRNSHIAVDNTGRLIVAGVHRLPIDTGLEILVFDLTGEQLDTYSYDSKVTYSDGVQWEYFEHISKVNIGDNGEIEVHSKSSLNPSHYGDDWMFVVFGADGETPDPTFPRFALR